jgi:virulence factor
MKIALIGLGRIAQKAYLPILSNHPEVDPVLCTRNTKTLKALSGKFRIDNTYSNLEQLIRSKPDAAMVHSSTDSHVTIATKLLHAGIPVFIDKPLSYSLEEAEKVLDLSSKYNVPLYLGFNRRFAPLIRSLAQVPDPIQVSWQKNRVDLAGDPRIFIFDDFIHVIDSLRFLGKESVKNIKVFSRMHNGMLENVQVQWQQGATFLAGGMNRVSGITEERVELYSTGNKWTVHNLNSGTHSTQEQSTALTFDPWDTALYQRGFDDMIEDWLGVVRAGHYNPDTLKEIWATHQLCETILEEVLARPGLPN